MDGTSDSAMDIEYDDSSMGKFVNYRLDFTYFTSAIHSLYSHAFVDSSDIDSQASESDEEYEGLNLLEMPREILEHILADLDAKSMLIASHVCKSFASAVETAFARKYANDYYYLCYGYYRHFGGPDFIQRETAFEKTMVAKYGGLMREIHMLEVDEETLDLVERNCHSLERARLINVPRMIELKDLKEVCLIGVRNLNRGTFAEFINRNQQLETLVLRDTRLSLIEVLDGQLNSLKTFKYDRQTIPNRDFQKIRLNSLESLKLRPTSNRTNVRVLQALECNRLKNLVLRYYDGPDDNDAVTNEICKFKELTLLRASEWQITSNQLKKLAAHLPHLTEFIIGVAHGDSHSILMNISSVMLMFPKVSKLKIYLAYETVYSEFIGDAKKFIADAHCHLASASTEVEIRLNDEEFAFVSKDFAYVQKSGLLELHWMTNLNANNVRKAMPEFEDYEANLKFISHCGDHPVDISALLPKFIHLKSLDVEANGPITFKENVSEFVDFSFCMHFALLLWFLTLMIISNLAVITSLQLFPWPQKAQNSPGRTPCNRLPSKTGRHIL